MRYLFVATIGRRNAATHPGRAGVIAGGSLPRRIAAQSAILRGEKPHLVDPLVKARQRQ